MLKSKIHRATVTGADLHYEGSITIDDNLLRAADVVPFEMVDCWNVTTGARFRTYAMRGEAGSGVVCVNGAAAHLVRRGDRLIIATWCELNDAEAWRHQPTIVLVDEQNRPRVVPHEIPGPDRRAT
jgi:aspartate 1-decarboxylase